MIASGRTVTGNRRTITVNRRFMRPAPETFQALTDVPTGNVVDIQGRRGALPARIRPITRAIRFIGLALTVRCRPADSLAALVALNYLQPGDVLVIATDAHEGAAVIGDHFVAMARGRGAAAIVTDGMTRDAAELLESPIPVFIGGITPNGSYKDGPGDVGLPVSLGSAVVHSGDIVLGDSDGVVIVRQEQLSAVSAAIPAILERERQNARAIAGAVMPDWLARFVAETEIIDDGADKA
jgi:4-hydroxy-4-methyl-2-oxoglutarate aldolase